ncbi:hypothetical protein JVT61DRAFT_957 [Boletus reticuloceps]|uniref:Uncharacterized protein n=1 Tax=Boletus reticuloceps TaxID=495285 RepID=A0A8I3AC51_9AGAM|nr:hypothetical protein JVT61DRAFT_957 [Boletus reticuloceps]
MDELRVHYPARFTWAQLKTFVNSGDLGLLKRDKKLQARYDQCNIGIKEQYGSVIDYLLSYRLQWGKPDTLSLLTSSMALDDQPVAATEKGGREHNPIPEYFKADIPFNSELICIIRNDWPYSVPPEIEHSLIWSRVPVFHPTLIPPAIEARIQQDGLCGFTGSTDSIESLPSLESCLPALAEWGITMDNLVRSPSGNEVEETMVKNTGKEVREFVKRRWKENQWETAWFVNPPRLQSIRGLAHVHVFARRKTAEEEAAWGP